MSLLYVCNAKIICHTGKSHLFIKDPVSVMLHYLNPSSIAERKDKIGVYFTWKGPLWNSSLLSFLLVLPSLFLFHSVCLTLPPASARQQGLLLPLPPLPLPLPLLAFLFHYSPLLTYCHLLLWGRKCFFFSFFGGRGVGWCWWLSASRLGGEEERR